MKFTDVADVQAGFRKGPEIKLPNPLDHLKSKRVPEKHLLPLNPKPFTVWITTNSGKFLKRWEYQTT